MVSNLREVEKLSKDGGCPPKSIDDDCGVVEEDHYKPRGMDNLRYHYMQKEVDYNL